MITHEDFTKVELKIGTITSAEAIEGTDKLLKLSVDMGESHTLVAGIAEHYEPEKLIGHQIVIVANLEPRTIRGVESQGMLLVASDGNKIILVSPDQETTPGSSVS